MVHLSRPPVVPFAQADITEAEEQAVLRVLKSGWLTSGPEMQAFEEELAQAVRANHVVACSSATAGLHLALEALGIGPGDEVLVPTWTFTATAEVVEYVGATPVLVDVNPHTLNVTVGLLEQYRTEQTKVVIVVHVAGVPCDMDGVWIWARQHGIVVIEDAAHALGSVYHALPIGGGRSEAVVFSFYATKCLTTGEGGAVATPSPLLATRMRQMRLHGIDRDAFARYTTDSAHWEYDVIAAGFKYNLPDVLAALGRVQLSRLEEMRLKRQAVADYYDQYLPVEVERPVRVSHGSEHLYIVRVEERDRMIQELYARGIGCSVHFKPLHLMTYWKAKVQGRFSGADFAYASCLSLPLYSTLTPVQMDAVVQGVYACLP